MSTKNLARTVIEGGRTNRSKDLRRTSLRYLRKDNRDMCHALRVDPEGWYEAELPIRARDWEDIDHADKVRPCDRFLDSKDGKSWEAIHSEICARFDRRTLAGRHVTNCHLLVRVEDSRKGDPYGGGYGRAGGFDSPIDSRYWIDAQGIFRVNRTQRF